MGTTLKPAFYHVRETLLDRWSYVACRVGDSQRDDVVSYLSLAYSHGYISAAEHEKLMARALKATNEDHLFGVMVELPASIDTPDPAWTASVPQVTRVQPCPVVAWIGVVLCVFWFILNLLFIAGVI